MNTSPVKRPSIQRMIWIVLMMTVFAAIALGLDRSTTGVSARAGDDLDPACGKAIIDGNVSPTEWSNASKQTFQMVSPNNSPSFTATLYVMNGRRYLYLGITINDDEFTTLGTWLPQGDGFRLDFDNDHSGKLFALHDDVLDIFAGSPQFEDAHIVNSQTSSATADVTGGGSSDGLGAAHRAGSLNHYEMKHPLCSGDALDFCLHPNDTVGFRLEYLDAQGDGSFGGSQLYPGATNTSIAEIMIGQCAIADWSIYLPLIQK